MHNSKKILEKNWRNFSKMSKIYQKPRRVGPRKRPSRKSRNYTKIIRVPVYTG